MASNRENDPPAQNADLRRLRDQAENRLHGDVSGRGEYDAFERERLIQELQVRQIELEIQNEELRASQTTVETLHHRFFNLFLLAPVGCFLLDERGFIREVNLSGAELLRQSRAHLQNTQFFSFLLEDDRGRWGQCLKKMLREDEKAEAQLRLVRENGLHLWCKVQGIAFRDDDRSVLVFLTDISNVVMSGVFSAVGIGLCVTDEDGRLVNVNEAFCKIYGYRQEELIGREFTMLLEPEYRDYAMDLHRRTLEQNEEPPTVWSVRRKDGGGLQVAITAERMQLPDGRRFKITTVVDETAKRQMEQDLIRNAFDAAKSRKLAELMQRKRLGEVGAKGGEE